MDHHVYLLTIHDGNRLTAVAGVFDSQIAAEGYGAAVYGARYFRERSMPAGCLEAICHDHGGADPWARIERVTVRTAAPRLQVERNGGGS